MTANVKRFRSLCAILAIAISTSLAAEGSSLVASVSADAVEVTNVSTGGEVVFLWASLDSVHGFPREATGTVQVRDDDGDGIVRVIPKQPIPPDSIWVAVDLQSGRHAVARPEGYPITIMEFPAGQDGRDILAGLAERQARVEILTARPRKGSWRLRDIGRPPHRDRPGPANAEAKAVPQTDDAPPELMPGDIVAIIDAVRMEVFVTEIGQ
jgi:hypothetical protein